MIIGLAEFEHGVKLVARVDDPSPDLGMEVGLKQVGPRAEPSERSADVVLVRSPPGRNATTGWAEKGISPANQ